MRIFLDKRNFPLCSKQIGGGAYAHLTSECSSSSMTRLLCRMQIVRECRTDGSLQVPLNGVYRHLQGWEGSWAHCSAVTLLQTLVLLPPTAPGLPSLQQSPLTHPHLLITAVLSRHRSVNAETRFCSAS